MSTRPSHPMRVASSTARAISEAGRAPSTALGRAERMAMEVSDRTNISRKYADTVKQALGSPSSAPSGHSAWGKAPVQLPPSGSISAFT